jgi:TonB family protein
VASAPAAAPPPAALAAFDFTDGAKAVITTTNVVELYKGQIEYAFRSRWVRPEGMADDAYVAEVQVEIDPSGKVLSTEWKKGSGNPKWDDSVKKALGQTRTISRPPPKDFPSRFVVRFDVQAEADPIAVGGTVQ